MKRMVIFIAILFTLTSGSYIFLEQNQFGKLPTGDRLEKIKKSKTDSATTIAYDESRPEIYNLLNIFAVFAKKTPQQIAFEYENSGYGKFKQDLADLLISSLQPISTKISQLLDDKIYLQKILQEGKFYAKQIASKTQDDVYKIIGLN